MPLIGPQFEKHGALQDESVCEAGGADSVKRPFYREIRKDELKFQIAPPRKVR